MEREPINYTKKETLEDDKVVIGNEKEETVVSNHEEESTNEDKTNNVKDQPPSRVSEIGSNDDDDDEPSRLNLETSSSAHEEKREATAADADEEDIRYEESMQLFQELCEERDKAIRLNRQLQTKLAQFLSKTARDHGQLEGEKPEAEQLQEYEKHISILNDLRQQLAADAESGRQQAEELRLQSQEKLHTVENEWRALVELKRDAAVTALSRRLGKEAQAKVEAVLKAEQLRQDELVKVRLKHARLVFRVRRLEAELREEEEHGRDPLQIRFEQLQNERLKQKKLSEKESEESLRLQRKISVCLEVLSNVKEKLRWSQMEVQAKREQLAEVEATVARRRAVLTRTKQARNCLQRDNMKLKERCGLLGNTVLLRDFEETLDASKHLEKHLEDLKSQHAEIHFSCDRWRKKMVTELMNES